VQEIIKKFKEIKMNQSWSFEGIKRKETNYITHSYHRYPAKFIPQIVARLIDKYTNTGDLVVDPFGGCGTTLVESKVMGRPSIGVDINPVAVLIAQAKITPIEPIKLEQEYITLKNRIYGYFDGVKVNVPIHERIDYWFRPEEKRKLAFILGKISKIDNEDIRNFFLCGFSNILKNCSIWLQKSNKPTRDFKKIPSEPINTFFRQIKANIKKNQEFYSILKGKGNLKISCLVYPNDARKIPTNDNTVSLIITSPPYVTSYEYADLHQLTALWLEYTNDLPEFRKRFIGTAYKEKKKLELDSEITNEIVSQLSEKSKKTANEVENYFGEMNQVFKEMKRILKKEGRTCIVIGNTSLKGVEILNAEVFAEQLLNLKFEIENIIKREIPSKNLPSTRDPKTGKFTKTSNKNKTFAYPVEYIIIGRKI